MTETFQTAQAQPVELDPKPRANSSPFPSWMSRYMTPNAIHLTLQILSIITFCSLLVPYMQYSRAKKAANNEICMQDAQTLYVNNLTQCEVKTATSLRGGVLGLNWVEMALLMAVAAVWQYAAWFAQGWLIVRISFLKKDCKE